MAKCSATRKICNLLYHWHFPMWQYHWPFHIFKPSGSRFCGVFLNLIIWNCAFSLQLCCIGRLCFMNMAFPDKHMSHLTACSWSKKFGYKSSEEKSETWPSIQRKRIQYPTLLASVKTGSVCIPDRTHTNTSHLVTYTVFRNTICVRQTTRPFIWKTCADNIK